jgi:RHS repeat-associated protein
VLERRWFVNDRLGSATVVIASDGNLEREVVYTPFGAEHQAAGANPRKIGNFAGHRSEAQTGLFYMRARWHDAATGTLLSVDTVVLEVSDPQSYNGYAYARNNPVRYTDPTGMFWWDWSSWSTPGWTYVGYTFEQAGGWLPTYTTAGSGFSIGPGPGLSFTPGGLASPLAGGLNLGGGGSGSPGSAPGSQSQSSEPRTDVTYGYTDTPVGAGTNHVVVIGTDPVTGESYATRAGPALGRGDGGCCTIFAEAGVFDESFRDPPSKVHTRQPVGTLNISLAEFAARANEFRDVTNANRPPYLGFTSNSNSYGFTFGESLGLGRPWPTVWAPGWWAGTPSPGLSYLEGRR